MSADGLSSQERRRAYFDALAAKRERDSRRHRVYYDDRVRWLKTIVPAHARVIDLGCGIGTVLSQLQNEHKVGIDFSSTMIGIAQHNDGTSKYSIDHIEELKHKDSYDYVLLLDAIHYLSDVGIALRCIRSQLCHPRTRIVITHYNFLWAPLFLLGELLGWKTKFPEQNWLSRSAIHNLLHVEGFEVIEVGDRVLCPLRIPLLEPLCNRILASLPLLRKLCLVRVIIARPVWPARHEYTVTVLSAVRNERGNIQKIVDSMPVMGNTTELLFVEGHSTDGTWEEIQRVLATYRGPLILRALQQPGTGKADALHFGAAASNGDIIIVYDGDYTVDPKELPQLYTILAEGRAEFVNASRLVYPMQQGAMRLLNLCGNALFSMMFSWLFRHKIVDSLSPVKAFFRRDYAWMETRFDPFGDFDFFLGAAREQLLMREVPVHYLSRTYGATKLRPLHHGWILLRLWFRGARMLRWV